VRFRTMKIELGRVRKSLEGVLIDPEGTARNQDGEGNYQKCVKPPEINAVKDIRVLGINEHRKKGRENKRKITRSAGSVTLV